MGVYGYVGCPGSGKTTLALSHINARGRFIVLDLQAAGNFEQWTPRVESWSDAVAKIFKGANPAWTPEDVDDVGELCIELQKLKAGISLLIDEAYLVWSPAYNNKPVASWLRTTGHHKGNAHYTTQGYSDLSPAAHKTTDRLYIFRCTYTNDLERIERDCGFPRAAVAALPQAHCLEYTKGGFR